MNEINISRIESNAIKGILIILVIIGHSSRLYDFPVSLRSFIYTFHYHCFFILPFLYPIKPISKNRIKKYIARLLIPYLTLFFIAFSFLLLKAVREGDNNIPLLIANGLKTVILGGYYPLHNFFHIRYMWFLPAMFTLILIKDYFYSRAAQYEKKLILFCGIIFYYFLWVCLKGPYCSEIREEIMYLSPLSIWQAVGVCFLSWLTVNIISYIKKQKHFGSIKYLKVFIFVIFVVLFVLFIKTSQDSILLLPMKSILPIVAFLFLFSYRKTLSKINIFRKYGEHSFEIYIVQTPISVVMYTMIPKYVNTESLYIRIFLFFLVIVICYYMALLVKKIPYINRVLFPRSWDEFMGRSVARS